MRAVVRYSLEGLLMALGATVGFILGAAFMPFDLLSHLHLLGLSRDSWPLAALALFGLFIMLGVLLSITRWLIRRHDRESAT